ncbi:MAG TPA: RluA family pseudouridine synthase, partial [Solirubrobacteraceae bacterium]
VLVDGEPRPKRHVLRGGERVEVDEEEAVAQPAPVGDAPFEIAYSDEDLLVVDKPAGVVVHPARGHAAGTLAQAIGGGLLVHRLDRDTSGLLLVARTEQAHRALKAALQAREIEREYLALVEGRPSARTGTIDAPIGRDRRVRTRHSTRTDTPRIAVTHFAIERTLPEATLLRVRLETGRTHQIRVHLQAIGHPVCGDPEYGTRGRFGLQRQFLHAARLAFDQPRTKKRLDVASPLPADLESALREAGGK